MSSWSNLFLCFLIVCLDVLLPMPQLSAAAPVTNWGFDGPRHEGGHWHPPHLYCQYLHSSTAWTVKYVPQRLGNRGVLDILSSCCCAALACTNHSAHFLWKLARFNLATSNTSLTTNKQTGINVSIVWNSFSCNPSENAPTHVLERLLSSKTFGGFW